MRTKLWQGATALAVTAAVSACAAAPTQRSATGPTAVLNGLSPTDVVAAIDAAGMPTPNAHDVTAVKCPKLRCASAVDSDTVSILKFSGSGPAQLYAGNISNVYQVENLVLVFAPTVTTAQKAAYERVVDHAVT